MATPVTSGSFGDLLDPLFQKVFQDRYKQLPDMLPMVFGMEAQNGRDKIKWSQVGTFGDFQTFNGLVSYDTIYQGYDVEATYLQYTSGFQVERVLYDDDQFNIMNQRPSGLAIAANRTRQKHGARLFNNAFSVDTLFYVQSEGVALCSSSHTTTSGASTATGFDNLVTSALSATAVSAARTQMREFRDDRGERISVMPNGLWVPIDLEDQALEIVKSAGQVDSANNNINPQEGRFQLHVWNYLTDTNNWFMVDGTMQKEAAKWVDRVPLEFAYVEDFDTLVAKWRAYMRHAFAWNDWRWILGAQVS